MTEIVFHQNDNLIEVDQLTNVATGAYLNSATVSCRVLDSSGAAVAGETWPITLGYVASSNGKYRGTLRDSVAFIAGRSYVAEITADAGADLKALWALPLKVEKRTS